MALHTATGEASRVYSISRHTMIQWPTRCLSALAELLVMFILSHCMHMCYYCNTVGWTWWDWSLILEHLPSVLWLCWFGHLTCIKYKPVPDMTYNVFGTTTLNLNQSMTPIRYLRQWLHNATVWARVLWSQERDWGTCRLSVIMPIVLLCFGTVLRSLPYRLADSQESWAECEPRAIKLRGCQCWMCLAGVYI